MIEDYIVDYVSSWDNDDYIRPVRRYWASEINSIKTGYFKPKNFHKKRKQNIFGSGMILTGVAMENMLTKIVKSSDMMCVTQEKMVLNITDEIELVVKPDYAFPSMVWETKFPFWLKDYTVIPERYNCQLECEYRAFEKTVFLGMFTVPFNVKFIEYIPSDKLWEEIQEVIIDFHEKVKEFTAENILEPFTQMNDGLNTIVQSNEHKNPNVSCRKDRRMK